MASRTSWLRICAGMILATGLLGLGSGCHSGSKDAAGTVKVNGIVTFTRLPVAYDATGAPTGSLGSTGVVSVARYVRVRAFQLYTEYDASGTATRTWRLAGTALTDTNGDYSIENTVQSGYPTFIELDSVFQQSGGHSSTVQVTADVINSTTLQSDGVTTVATPELDRPIYAYRLDGAGTVVTDPTTANPQVLNGDTTVNFQFSDPATPWVKTLGNWYQQVTAALQAPTGTAALGSRALAILDSVYTFAYYYGDPTPSIVANGAMDLHYLPGQTESPRRSYMVYDTSLTPAASDGTVLHYFGTLAGGASGGADDAWDPGVIYPMLARNNIFGQGLTSLFPTGSTTLLTTEAPELAVVDGLADVRAATLLQTPFLTDTTTVAGLVARDIRVSTAPATGTYVASTAANSAADNVPAANSPAVVAAVGWNLVEYGHGYQPGTATPAQWATFGANDLDRLFNLSYPWIYQDGTKYKVRTDEVSLYGQLSRLQEPKDGGDILDTPAIYSDSALYLLLAGHNIPWNTSTTWASNTTNWGTNPGFSAVGNPSSSFALTMTDPVIGDSLIPTPNITGAAATAVSTPNTDGQVYSSLASGEVAFAALSLTLDATYTLTVTPQPALGSDAYLEVMVDGAIVPSTTLPTPQGPFVFSSTLPGPYTLALTGNSLDATNPIWHFLRFRLVSTSATATEQPNVNVAVSLSYVAPS
jgi:hypothetical protein